MADVRGDDHFYSRQVAGVEVHAERGMCPVCRHPTGDCVGESGPPLHVIPYIERAHRNATVRVPQRVFEESYVGSKRVRRLLYPAGALITPAEARRIGLVAPDDIDAFLNRQAADG
jgi:hypothetical protein